MIFPTTIVAALGLASFAVAAPHSHSNSEKNIAAREPEIAARGVHWNRANQRSGSRNNRNVISDITITQLQDTVIQDRNREVELVQLVQERIIVVDNSRQLRDNVRRNTFKNRNNNNNNNQNVVIVVVQTIVDQRQGGNNVRYLARKLQSNGNSNSNQNAAFVVINEANTYTIRAGDQATRVQSILAASTNVPQQQFAIYNPGANLTAVASNSTLSARSFDSQSEILLPAGSAAPQWRNGQQSSDPAVILDANTREPVFVAFNNQNSRNSNDVAIIVVN